MAKQSQDGIAAGSSSPRNDRGMRVAPNFFKVAMLAFCLCFVLGFSTLILLEKTDPYVILNSFQDLVSSRDGMLKQSMKQVQDMVQHDKKTEGQVLQASTTDNTLFFNVNIPSKFAEDSEFLKGISVSEIASLSGGIITNDADIDAGTGTLTASNVLYGLTAATGISVGTGQNPTITNTDLGSSQKIFIPFRNWFSDLNSNFYQA